MITHSPILVSLQAIGKNVAQHDPLWNFEKALEFVFQKHFEQEYADFKLWLGLALWLSVWAMWLTKGYSGSFEKKAAFTFGINLWVLHLLQYHGRFGLMVALLVLNVQSATTVFLWWKDEDVVKAGQFKCNTLYQDLSIGIVQVFFLFIGQTFLIFFYAKYVYTHLDVSSMTYTFWFAAYFAAQMSAFFNRGVDSFLDVPWPSSMWWNMIENCDEIQFESMAFDRIDRVHSVKLHPFSKAKWDLVVRGIFGFLVHNMFRDILAFTVPIMLCSFTSSMNFVVYCVASSFIVSLDGLHYSDKTIGVSLRKDKQPVAERIFSVHPDDVQKDEQRVAQSLSSV